MPAVDRGSTPNGEYLAARLRETARELGLDLSAQVQRFFHRSSFGVQVDWPRDATGDGIHCEVAESADSVIVAEPRPTEMRIEQAVAYVIARAQGSSPAGALSLARPPRQRWWKREDP
jgi:hypothetical protein